MKLYQDDASPFASRVRIQLYHKDLDIEFTAPPGGPRSEEYRKINPLGLIPALATPHGLLSESVAIMEYLEDLHPEPSMRPRDAFARATLRRFVCYHDGRVQPQLGQLFRQLMSGASDRTAIDAAAAATREALQKLDTLAGDLPDLDLSLADCVLAPTMYFAPRLAGMLGIDSPVDGLAGLGARWERIRETDPVEKVTGELDAAMARFAAGSGPPR